DGAGQVGERFGALPGGAADLGETQPVGGAGLLLRQPLGQGRQPFRLAGAPLPPGGASQGEQDKHDESHASAKHGSSRRPPVGRPRPSLVYVSRSSSPRGRRARNVNKRGPRPALDQSSNRLRFSSSLTSAGGDGGACGAANSTVNRS